MRKFLFGLAALGIALVTGPDAVPQPAEVPALPVARSAAVPKPVEITGADDALRAVVGEGLSAFSYVSLFSPEEPGTDPDRETALVVQTALGTAELSEIAVEAGLLYCQHAERRRRPGGPAAPDAAVRSERPPHVPLPVLASEGIEDALVDVVITPLLRRDVPGRVRPTAGRSSQLYKVEILCQAGPA